MNSPKIDDVEGLYEQAKKLIRGTWETDENFVLACQICGLILGDKQSMGVAQAHHEQNHPNKDFVLDLVYIGSGMPPKPRKNV